MPVREGLGRLDGVAFISERPDLKAATCELRLQGGRLVDPHFLSNHVFNIRVGARLRGLEATVGGVVQSKGTNLVFAVGGTNTVLRLAPLTRKVQQNVALKQPQPTTPQEAKAFAQLGAKMKSRPRRAQIIGPLLTDNDGALVLEVRSYKFLQE